MARMRRGESSDDQATIRELQRQVAHLNSLIEGDAGGAGSWAEVRDGLRSIADDLGARIGALAERVERLEARAD